MAYKIGLYVLILSIGCSACINVQATKVQDHSIIDTTSNNWRCGPINRIEEEDLIGVWQTDFRTNGSSSDTLVINEDGRYFQSYINQKKNIKYTSEWKRWWLEPRVIGGYYLHLERMQYCGGVEGTCLDPGGNGLSFYDLCEDVWLEMDKEFILAVVWDTSVPGNIKLRHMKPQGYTAYYVNYIRID